MMNAITYTRVSSREQHQVRFDVQVLQRDRVTEVAVEPIRLFHKQRPMDGPTLVYAI
jgi:hypothetical protein